MPDQENNPGIVKTNSDEVVNQTEIENPEISGETSIEPLENNSDENMITSPVDSTEEKFEPENSIAEIDSTPAENEMDPKKPLENMEEAIPELDNTLNEESVAIKKPRAKKVKSGIPKEQGTPEHIDGQVPSLEVLKEEAPVDEKSTNLDPIHHEEEEEDEETKMIEEEEAINLDYSAYTKEQLLHLAIEAPQKLVAREAVKRLQNIRPFFDDLLKLERQEQLAKHLESGNEEETFAYHDDGSKQKFYDAFKMAQESRAEEKKRIEDEKLKNLATKNAIIERIKVLTESDETVDSLTEIKQLQNEWKAIRVVPKTNLQELYDRYHFYLDKFYDNFAINREL